MEDSASCVSMSVNSSTNVKDRVADLARVVWDITPRLLYYLPRPHMVLGSCAILTIPALTLEILSTSLATWTFIQFPYVHSASDNLSLVNTSKTYSPILGQLPFLVTPALFDLYLYCYLGTMFILLVL